MNITKTKGKGNEKEKFKTYVDAVEEVCTYYSRRERMGSTSWPDEISLKRKAKSMKRKETVLIIYKAERAD